jgi:serine/threonine-protein kinase
VRSILGEVLLGTYLGHYRLDKKVGKSPYGDVYLGVNRHDEDLKVTVKIVHAALINDAEFLKVLKSEWRNMNSMDHSSIVRLRDLIIDGDRVALITDWLEGCYLHERLNRGPLSLSEGCSVIESILHGLAYRHTRGLLFRDIRPYDIFLCDDGRVKVFDLGLARAAENSIATNAGILKASLPYVAPERMSMNGGGPPSDVYALGMVAYEILTGKSACPPGDLWSMMWWHTSVGASDIRSMRPDCPGGVAEAIMRMCAQDIAARPADGVEALQLWQHNIQGVQIEIQETRGDDIILDPLWMEDVATAPNPFWARTQFEGQEAKRVRPSNYNAAASFSARQPKLTPWQPAHFSHTPLYQPPSYPHKTHQAPPIRTSSGRRPRRSKKEQIIAPADEKICSSRCCVGLGSHHYSDDHHVGSECIR